ncbi:NAD-dependent epimerase/dehydratase family protein [Muriicola soli]|uniref:NAD-dependent epimerase/dehydratase family protein n=1 Tax=Muriicola soli TaxID=2507538 RepID=A0A411ECT2_9FLAO|nr:NAD-dependent epimerase/dehydratase family protein [Muriicola soli]QBA65257.1 NAD-dependent epimerase/dehydratase family protein [Muriicola soli]
MDQPEKSAIVLGATGLTGGILLKELLQDPRYTRIVVFSRSTAGIQHPKYEEYLGDLFSLSEFSAKFKADEVYCCIGTTKAKTPDKEKYRKIDLGIPLDAAQLCVQNKIDTFIVMSSLGANPKSSVFYSRVKGEMEEAVLQLGLPKTHILQPSLISGEREESRKMEKLAKTLFSILNVLLIGPLKKYRSVRAKDIAKAMIWLANNKYGQERITSDKITQLANA